MPVIDQEILHEQLEADQESWKAAHDRAMACRNLEDTLRRGLRLYRMFRDMDETWSRKVQSGETKFDEKRARSLRTLYEWWVIPCDTVLAAVETMEREGYVVTDSAEFKDARLQVKSFLRVPIDRLIAAMVRTAAA